MPQVLVFNKLDEIPEARRPLQLRGSFDLVDGEPETAVPRVFVSARTGQGLDELRKVLVEFSCSLPPPTPVIPA